MEEMNDQPDAADSTTTTTSEPFADESKGWIDGLPDDLRESPRWEKFSQADDVKMVEVPETVLRSYGDLESRLGKKSLPIPETDEQKAEVAEALGWDKDFESYSGALEKVEVPEGVEYDQQEEDFLLQLAHQNHIPAKEASAIRKQIVETRVKAIQDQKEARESYLNEVKRDFEKEFGGDLGTLKNRAKAAMEDYGDDGLIEIFENAEYDGRKLGDHPAFFKFMAKLGKDKLGLSDERGNQTNSESAESIQDQIAEIQSDPAYMNGDHPEHAQKVKKMQRLFQQLHGEY